MSFELFLPFGILIALIIYFIYSRTKFEKDIVALYETKFEEWKKHNISQDNKSSHKELVGLIFEQEYKLSIELINEDVKQRVLKGKFFIKE